MKAFIIHVSHSKKSVEYAHQALASFDNKAGWEPELFEGVTIKTLPKYDEKYGIKTKKDSRAIGFNVGHPPNFFEIKKSCALNHYRLFHKCIEINEPLVVIEHDSHCIGNWTDIQFDDVLVLNYNSAIRQTVLRPVWDKNPLLTEPGITDTNFSVKYKYDNIHKNESVMPGSAAYAITPKGAQRMINIIDEKGWDQSDYIMNTGHVRIQIIMPELFTFKLPNLSMSHGKNL